MADKCSHTRCDLCFSRECDGATLQYYSFHGTEPPYTIKICLSCQRHAVKFAYDTCATWGGYFEPSPRECGFLQRKKP